MEFDAQTLLPLTFAALMGLSILLYVVLDGFDLGIGILSIAADEEERDTMIAAIGPFWDANETWLVLAVGLLLVAFPIAHGIILTALYVPVFTLLVGLILRGVAFDFRAKVPVHRKQRWDRLFFAGSLMAALSQGYMLGLYVLGLANGLPAMAFALLTAVCLAAAYAAIGAAWMIYKSDGNLQDKAVRWLRRALLFAAAGMAAVSLATPLASPRIFSKWFAWPEMAYLAPLPLISVALFTWVWRMSLQLPGAGETRALAPFATLAAIFAAGFAGLAYSFYPYVVPDRITIWEAAADESSLSFILVGTAAVLPVILGYTIYAYRVFGGKATDLSYD